MPDLSKFDKAVEKLRAGVTSMPEHLSFDGITGVVDLDDATGETKAIALYAWGESAKVLRRVLKMEPGQTPKYIRDSH